MHPYFSRLLGKVQRADLTCNVIRKVAPFVLSKLWILVDDWSMRWSRDMFLIKLRLYLMPTLNYLLSLHIKATFCLSDSCQMSVKFVDRWATIYTDRIHISSIPEVRMKEAKEFVSTFITPALSLLLCGRRVSFFLLLPYMKLEKGERKEAWQKKKYFRLF